VRNASDHPVGPPRCPSFSPDNRNRRDSQSLERPPGAGACGRELPATLANRAGDRFLFFWKEPYTGKIGECFRRRDFWRENLIDHGRQQYYLSGGRLISDVQLSGWHTGRPATSGPPGDGRG
jgi:hypothetical protein